VTVFRGFESASNSWLESEAVYKVGACHIAGPSEDSEVALARPLREFSQSDEFVGVAILPYGPLLS
jgi:hypothetical protein